MVEAEVGLYDSLDPRPRSWRNGLGPASITPMAAPPVGSSPTGGLFVVGAGLLAGRLARWLAGSYLVALNLYRACTT